MEEVVAAAAVESATGLSCLSAYGICHVEVWVLEPWAAPSCSQQPSYMFTVLGLQLLSDSMCHVSALTSELAAGVKNCTLPAAAMSE